MWVYVLCAVVIIAAIPTAVWLKRAGDENWRLHQTRLISVRIVADFSKFTAALAAMGPALAKATAAAADFDRALRKAQETIRNAKRTP